MAKLSAASHRLKAFIPLAALLVISVAAGFLGGWLGATSRFTHLNHNQQKYVVSSESELISEIAQTVGESVVSINVSQASSVRDYFGRPLGGQSGAGTGFILNQEGIVVTNRHVVPEGTTSVSIVLADGTELDDVEVIGRTGEGDPLDIAFLKVNDTKGKTLQPAKLGNSDNMVVGDKVVAIGNALGQFQNTVTSGIISGFGRDVQARSRSGLDSLQDLFQTDAAINQGNSGGPLVNMNGEVIGINTAVAGNAQNIGFAIPIDQVTSLINSVLRTGRVERPYLGVRYVSITDDYAKEYNLPVNRGAFIVPSSGSIPSIIPGSPADKAGLRPGDVITEINDTPVDGGDSLAAVLGRFEVGQWVVLTVIRDGNEQKVNVTLDAVPQN